MKGMINNILFVSDLFWLKPSSLRRRSKQEEHDEASSCDPYSGHHERQPPIGLVDSWVTQYKPRKIEFWRFAPKNVIAHLHKCSSDGVPQDIANARVAVPDTHYQTPNMC